MNLATLVTLLGRDMEDPEIMAFIASLSTDATWEHDEDASFCTIHSHGLELKFGASGRLSSIFLFPGEGGAKAYQGQLPGGIDFNLSRDRIRKMLGPAIASGGGTVFLNESVPPWDKYDFGNYLLHIQYPDNESSVSMVTLQSKQ